MNSAKDAVTIVVMGGAGAMGRITVRDLVETAPDNVRIVIADFNEAAAKQLARSFKRKVDAIRVDANDVRKTAKAFEGAFAVINCTQHAFNLKVMQAALSAGAHYTDLGGLFHVTKEQLEMNAKFEKANLLALLGMGAAPGITNVLARAAADTMDEVHEIHTIVGNVDRTPDRPITPMGVSYSIQTIMDEASQPAALFTHGKMTFVDPMSGAEPVHFPEPVGVRRPAYTIHSELATLPYSYKSKGVREVSFRIAFSEALDEKLRFLRTIGMLSADPIQVGKAKTTPRTVLIQALSGMKREEFEGVPDEYEIVRAVVRGVKNGKSIEETVDCHVPGIPSWGFGVDVDTGCPPSIAMQMLLRGEITARGCVAAEVAVPAEPFFSELLKRGMTVRRRAVVHSGTAFAIVERTGVSAAAVSTVKRAPGRPRKGATNGAVVAPGAVAVAVAVAAKRGPGRPPKSASAPVSTSSLAEAEAETGPSASAPVKRGPGRPRKDAAAAAVKRGPGRPPKDAAAATEKRGPGRPPKSATASASASAGHSDSAPMKRGPGRPRKDAVAPASADAPAKRGPGRPRKGAAVVAAPAKRGPGRPPKSVSAEAGPSDGAPVKRGPGRPPKAAMPGAPVKRGPGRPKKEAYVVGAVKRGPGRPPKSTAGAVPVKRGPGRPPKHARA